jgi:Mrp family chromosome partitioning ATPase
VSRDGRRREGDASWPVALATVGRAEPVTLDDPEAVRAELLSLLRTRPASTDGRPHHLLVVVTGDRGEQGRSAVAADLAVALAGDGIRIALVDLDLGHPAQHRLFELPETAGFAEVALGWVPLGWAMRRLRAGRARPGPEAAGGIAAESLERGSVEVLTAGALPVGERMAVLAGPIVREVLELVSERADVVLVDTPPMARAGSASSPFPPVDALVVVAGRDRRRRRLLDAFRPVLDGAAPPDLGAEAPIPTVSAAGPWAAGRGGRADAWLAASLLAGGAAALLLASTGAETVVRPVVTLLFLWFAPGAAFVWLVRGLDVGTKVVASIALSLALGTMTAQAMLWAHAWSATTGLVVLVSLTVVGVLLQGWRWLRTGGGPGTARGRGSRPPGRRIRRTRPGEAGRRPRG